MLIAGSKFVGHDSSLAVIDTDSESVFASNTERYTLKKHDSLSPFEIIESEFSGRCFNNIGHSYSNFLSPLDYSLENSSSGILYDVQSRVARQNELPVSSELLLPSISLFAKKVISLDSNKGQQVNKLFGDYMRLVCKAAGVGCEKVSFTDHHTSHHLSAIYSNPSSCDSNIISFVSDGWGDGITTSAAVYDKKNGKVRYLDRSSVTFHGGKAYSIGELYADITAYLGFKRNCDEGRVEALAAFGEVNKRLETSILQTYGHTQDTLTHDLRSIELFHPRNLRSLLEGLIPQDIAATVQSCLETIILSYIRYHVLKTDCKCVSLSGGVHANVTLNNKIYSFLSENSCSIYVAPFMGDEGTSLGAAIDQCLRRDIKLDWLSRQAMPFWGHKPEINLKAIISIVGGEADVQEYDYESGIALISRGLADNQILALAQGSAEFGPRALGNRSIIAAATNPNAVARINGTIKNRPAWQPFCPAILDIEMERLLDSSYPNYHMSCSFILKDEFQKHIRCACHVDGSARAQCVTEATNSAFYAILTQLRTLTGFGVILNTSFNKSGHVIPGSLYAIINEFLYLPIKTLWLIEEQRVYCVLKHSL